MMKKLLTIASVALFALSASGQSAMVFEDGLRFDEGSVSYKNMVLVSNFGGSELNPLNNEGKGYIMAVTGKDLAPFIPCDGSLSAPKGMAIVDNHLYIADVNRVVVYNLKDLDAPSRAIMLPEGELFVNDIAALSTFLLVSVTNTGNIYSIDATDGCTLSEPKLVGNVPGANGIVVSGAQIYVASYNPKGIPTDENVIYTATAIHGQTSITPLIEGLPCGQYDGIALSSDGTTLYFSSWTGGEGGDGGAIYSYDLVKGGAAKRLDFGVKFVGPADIVQKDGFLYVPDLPASKLYRFKL